MRHALTCSYSTRWAGFVMGIGAGGENACLFAHALLCKLSASMGVME